LPRDDAEDVERLAKRVELADRRRPHVDGAERDAVSDRAGNDDEVARDRSRHEPQRDPMQHREHHEHGCEQKLVRGRIEHRADFALPAEAFGEKTVRRVGCGRGPEQGDGRDQLTVQQRKRYRYHQQDSQCGDAVRDVSQPSIHDR
jgi:hypothetical protein